MDCKKTNLRLCNSEDVSIDIHNQQIFIRTSKQHSKDFDIRCFDDEKSFVYKIKKGIFHDSNV